MVLGKVLSAARAFVTTLLLPETAGNVQITPTFDSANIFCAILDAIELHRDIHTKYLSYDYDIFLPSTGTQFYPSIMCLFVPTNASGSSFSGMEEDWVVLWEQSLVFAHYWDRIGNPSC